MQDASSADANCQDLKHFADHRCSWQAQILKGSLLVLRQRSSQPIGLVQFWCSGVPGLETYLAQEVNLAPVCRLGVQMA